jgi:glycosyltransferase involved in cell wall biosynthesis
MPSTRSTSGGAIWMTWERQRRNGELAAALGIPLEEWADLQRYSGWRKYLTGISRALLLLARRRPAVVVCQNPSIVLTMLLVGLRPITRTPVVVDAHNAGVHPFEGRSKLLNRIAAWLHRHADVTIVTNAELSKTVQQNGGRAFVLPDRIPRLEPGQATPAAADRSILFVCTYASDEPYASVFEAAKGLPADVVLYVTGNYKRKGLDPVAMPANVRLTGFIPDEEYVRMLTSVDVVMDLTERENCLVCGAYEALALGKPLILSDTKVNREYFSAGAVYTQHDANALAAAMMASLGRRDELAAAAVSLRESLQCEWQLRLNLLARTIERLSSQTRIRSDVQPQPTAGRQFEGEIATADSFAERPHRARANHLHE